MASAKYPYEQFSSVRLYQPTLAFSPDGAQIAYSTNTSGQFNLWRQSVEGGYPFQLTSFTDRAVREVAWSPDGKSILFTADRDGDEFHQIFLTSAEGGVIEQLTDAPKVQHFLSSSPWAPDSKSFVFTANDRSQTDRDILIFDVAKKKSTRVLEGTSFFAAGSWSPDGKFLSAVDFRSNSDSDLLLLDVKRKKTEVLTPHDGEVRYFPSTWAPDGSGFYVVSDEGQEFVGLGFFHIEARKLEWLETPKWDVESVSASKDGKYLAWVTNEDGYSKLNIVGLRKNVRIQQPEVPKGVISLLRFSPDSRRIAVLLGRPDNPNEIFILDVVKPKTSQITHGWIGGIDQRDLIKPKLIRYPTHDDRKIPAFLYKPKGSGKFPVVLSIHGGPEAQERPLYNYAGFYQYLLNSGIGILAPNVRGSTGYGKSYQKLIHRDWGGAELKDFEAAVQYLKSLEWVGKIGVFGGSFGGFATLSCITRLPDYWACGVDIVGPSNLVTFAKAVPPTWKRFMTQWVGDPETEVDFLMSRSPISFVDQVKAPLFIIQGANDPRVVKAESDQIVEKLRSKGIEVKYDVYEDEGHGFTRSANYQKALKDAATFLETHLL